MLCNESAALSAEGCLAPWHCLDEILLPPASSFAFLTRGHATKVPRAVRGEVFFLRTTYLGVLFLVATWELLGIWGQPQLFSPLWWIQLDGNDSIQVGLWPPRCQHSLVLNWFALLLDSPLRPGCPWMLGGRNLWRYAIWSICLVELGHFLGSCYLI